LDILQGGNVVLGYINYRGHVTRNISILRRSLECQYGLLNELVTRKVLSSEQAADIQAKGTSIQQRDKLLEFMGRLTLEAQRQELWSALKETNQSHLVRYLTTDIGKL